MGTLTKANRCTGKRRHESQTSAHRHLDDLVAHGASRAVYRVYPCDGPKGCGGWHVGHRMPSSGRRRVTR